MPKLNSRIREQAEAVLKELELLTSDESIEVRNRFAEVVKQLVHIRDQLIFA
jgi:hypothetical protein